MRKHKKLGVVYISYYVPSRLCSCHYMWKAIIFRDKVTCVVTNNIICFLYLCWGKSLTRPRKFCHVYGSLVKKRLQSLMKLRLLILQVKTTCRRILLSKLVFAKTSVQCTLYFVPCLQSLRHEYYSRVVMLTLKSFCHFEIIIIEQYVFCVCTLYYIIQQWFLFHCLLIVWQHAIKFGNNKPLTLPPHPQWAWDCYTNHTYRKTKLLCYELTQYCKTSDSI